MKYQNNTAAEAAWTEDELLPYRLGALLYTPAVNGGIARKIRDRTYPDLTSAALCLEDSIRDEALEQAERSVLETLRSLNRLDRPREQLPLLFVRIRNPGHLRHIHEMLGDEERVLTGYILPKFDLSNAERYAALITDMNGGGRTDYYFMPVLESRMIAGAQSRCSVLMQVKGILEGVRKHILNIRVGGTDLCHLYGVRRSERQTIYDIGVIRDILSDIVNIFGLDYVVSGPVWEYFGTNPQGPWAAGLRRELELDQLNGFIGKTAIHPSQLPLIREAMQVRQADYADAKRLLHWEDASFGVGKSSEGSRMNEVKCHGKWAQKIMKLAWIYGIRRETAYDL